MNLVSRILDRHSKWFNEKKEKSSDHDGYYRLNAIEKFEISPKGADLYFQADWIKKSGETVETKLLIRLENLLINENSPTSLGKVDGGVLKEWDDKNQYVSNFIWKKLEP